MPTHFVFDEPVRAIVPKIALRLSSVHPLSAVNESGFILLRAGFVDSEKHQARQGGLLAVSKKRWANKNSLANVTLTLKPAMEWTFIFRMTLQSPKTVKRFHGSYVFNVILLE